MHSSSNARHWLRIAGVGAAFLVLAACGNKGPLVMPQKPVPVEVQPATPPATQEPADAAQPIDGARKPVGDDDTP
ncbi:MAG TPA: lipoprotein [Stenotrophomonas sp.]